MKLLVALCLVGLSACAHGFSVESLLQERLQGLNIDKEEIISHSHKGHCACNRFGCWCHAVDAGVKVNAVFSVDECRHKCSKAKIVGTFTVGSKSVEKEFPVDEFEDFCENFDNKRFCFRVDINEKSGGYLRGCLNMSRPQTIQMGCFSLPLMTSSLSDDSDEDYEMEIPPQLVSVVNKRRKCMCCPHGCACHGTDDGYRVVAIFSLDECNHNSKYHKVIVGLFSVGGVTFEKVFHEKELKSFCQVAEGKKFCFKVTVFGGCGCHIRGHISLTSPKVVELGYFNIQLVKSTKGVVDDDDDDDDVDDVDDDVTTERDELISSDADDDGMFFRPQK